MALHGVGMSIGSSDPLNQDYLSKLKTLIEMVQPAFVSDHLCWISANEHYYHELLPLPFTEQAIEHVVVRIQHVQDYLQQPILIENVSSYLNFVDAELSEAEFLSEVAKRSGCFILLDINNIYVNANNHQFDAKEYLQKIPSEKVKQIHLAGFEDKGTHLFDSHSRAVHEKVWELYQEATLLMGAVPTLIEWDNDIPEFNVLEREAKKAKEIMEHALQNTTSVCE